MSKMKSLRHFGCISHLTGPRADMDSRELIAILPESPAKDKFSSQQMKGSMKRMRLAKIPEPRLGGQRCFVM